MIWRHVIEDSNLTTEAETEVMRLQAENDKDCWELPQVGKRQERLSSRVFRESTVLPTARFQILTSRTESRDSISVVLSHTLLVCCYSSSMELYRPCVKIKICGASAKESTCNAADVTLVWSLSREGPPEEGMATNSSILAWRISWTEKPGGGYSP